MVELFLVYFFLSYFNKSVYSEEEDKLFYEVNQILSWNQRVWKFVIKEHVNYLKIFGKFLYSVNSLSKLIFKWERDACKVYN